MINILMAILANVSHLATNIFETKPAEKPKVYNAHKLKNSSSPVKKLAKPILTLTPQIESMAKKNNESELESIEVPKNFAEYDSFSEKVNKLKRKIILNQLVAQNYKTQIGYDQPGTYKDATVIGVIIDYKGFKSARIKLKDDTTTEVEIGSTFGIYEVTAIKLNEVDLMTPECIKQKKSIHNSHRRKYTSRKNSSRRLKHNPIDDQPIVVHTKNEAIANNDDTDVDLNKVQCTVVKLLPLYRDINNQLPLENSDQKTGGSAKATGGAKMYNSNANTTPSLTHDFNGGTNISSGGISLTIPPIEKGSYGN